MNTTDTNNLTRIRPRAPQTRNVPPSGTTIAPVSMPTSTTTTINSSPAGGVTQRPQVGSRWLLDIPETCAELHVSRAGLFRLLARGELGPTVKIGRRRLIPITSIESYIARLITEGGDAA